MKLLIITQVMDTEHPILGFFHNWVKEFSKHYDSVEVICLQKGKCDLPSHVRVHSLGKEIDGNKFTYLLRFYSLIFTLRKNYDQVFVHMNQVYILLGGLFWRLLGKKVGFWYAHGHMDMSIKIAGHIADRVFTSTASGFRYDIPKKTIVGQGINTERFKCSRESVSETLRLVYVGRMSAIKGIDTLLESCKILHEQNIPFHLSLIGGATTETEATYFEVQKKFVKDNSLESSVTFVGHIPNSELPQYLCQSDIFINPSSTGSLDKTGVEAMSSGLVVLTCNEAYKEVLGNLTNELMFEKGNAVAIADKVIRYSDRDKRIAVGTQLRDIVVEHHSIERLMALISEKLKGVK